MKIIHIIIIGEENVKRYYDYSQIPHAYEAHSVIVHPYQTNGSVTTDSFGEINVVLIAFHGSNQETLKLAANIVNNIWSITPKPVPILLITDDKYDPELDKLSLTDYFYVKSTDSPQALFRCTVNKLLKYALLYDKAIAYRLETGESITASDAVQLPKNMRIMEDGALSTNVNIVLLGNTNEKADHVFRFITKKYKITACIIGVERFVQLVQFNNQIFRVQVYETAAGERYYSINRAYLRNATGVIYCAPIECADTFNACISRHTNDIPSGTPVSLIGINLDERLSHFNSSIQVEEAIRTARENNMLGYFECSARTGEGIEDAFLGSFELILKHAGLFEWLGEPDDVLRYSSANLLLMPSNVEFFHFAKNNSPLCGNYQINALMQAAASNETTIEELQVLVNNGISCASTDQNNNTALFYAAFHVNLTVVDYLLQKGLSLQAKNRFYQTVFDVIPTASIAVDLFCCLLNTKPVDFHFFKRNFFSLQRRIGIGIYSADTKARSFFLRVKELQHSQALQFLLCHHTPLEDIDLARLDAESLSFYQLFNANPSILTFYSKTEFDECQWQIIWDNFTHPSPQLTIKNAEDLAFHVLKHQQLQSNATVQHHLNYQVALRHALTELTHESRLVSLLADLRQLIHELYENHLPADALNQLLQQCVHPSLLLDQEALEKALNNKFSLISRYGRKARLFHPLNSLLRSLQQEKQKYLHKNAYEKIANLLTVLIEYYQQFREDLHIAGETNQSDAVLKFSCEPYLLSVLSQGTRELNSESTMALTPAKGETDVSRSSVPFGTHIVRRSPDGKIHFKYHDETMPCYPAIEYAVASFYNVLAQGQGIAPTEIVRLYCHNYQKVLIASLTVEGINLWDFLEQHAKAHPEYLAQFEPYSFTATIMTAILTQVGDGKADNYMVQFVRNTSDAQDGAEFLIKLVGIDTDIAFIPPILRHRRYGQHHTQRYVQHKCIFYWFPQMQSLLEPRFVSDFLTRDPILIMLDWLQTLSRRNRHYQQLQEAGVISEKDAQSLQLPIKFKPNTVANLYHQLRHIQQFLVEQKSKGQPTTHAALLAHCYPEIAAYYANLSIDNLPNDISAAERLLRKERKLYSASAASLQEARIIETNQSRAMMSKVAISTALQQEPERQQLLAEAMAEFIAQVDFNQIRTKEGQRLILQRFKEFKDITCVTLRNAAGLNDAALTALYEALPNLVAVNLIGCNNVTSQGILQAINTRKLHLSPRAMPQLSALYCEQLSPETLYDFHQHGHCPLGFVGYANEAQCYVTIAYQENATYCLHRLLMMQVTVSIGQLQLLGQLGADLDAQNKTQSPFNGYRPLHIAAKQNNKTLIHRLMALGADPTLNDASGESPYKKAAKYGLFGAANALREYTAVDPKEEKIAQRRAIDRIRQRRLQVSPQ